MAFQTEFPDYPIADMPVIPAGFEDQSWHNDACPCFVSDSAGLILFVDFADTSKREFDDGVRFSLNDYSENGGPGETLLSTDDWNEVLAFVAKRAV